MEVVLGLAFFLFALFVAYKILRLIIRIITAPFRMVSKNQRKESDYTVEVIYSDGRANRYGGKGKLDKNPSKYWYPNGKEVKVGKTIIPGGMVYIGKKLAESEYGYDVDAALINPSLKVKYGSRRADAETSYWPSYSTVSPSVRGNYLEWLAGDRSDPEADVGIVFLYFYGLERRMLVDPKIVLVPEAEKAQIRLEVSRLISIYGGPGSFGNYAKTFMDFTMPMESGNPIYLSEPPIGEPSWELPASVRVATAQLVRDEKPIPAKWALAWAWYSPETSIRTPARRCFKELQALFAMRYEQKFKEGLKVKPNKRRLKIEYHPASPSIRSGHLREYDDLPDVTSLKGPVRKFREILDTCTNELDPYSRWIGRHPDQAKSLQAMALLPPELLTDDNIGEAGKKLQSYLSGAVGVGAQTAISPERILEFWPPSKGGKYRKSDAVGLSQFLEKLGYGMEPDVRFNGPRLDTVDHAVAFRLGKDAPTVPSREYLTAALTLRLAAAIAVADGIVTEEEQRSLERQMETSDALLLGDRDRLRAHVEWLLLERPGVTGLKRKLEDIRPSTRTLLGQVLIAVAAADGHIDPEEIKIIKKLYRQLGLDPESIYSDIHAFTTEGAPPATEPISVRSEDRAKGYKIGDKPAAQVVDGTSGVYLDPKLIEAKLVDAQKANALLTEIFGDDEVEMKTSGGPQPVSTTVSGLDDAHSASLLLMLEKDQWEREEVAVMADELGLLVDGALETINEAAWDKVDDPVLDVADMITIDRQLLKEFLA